MAPDPASAGWPRGGFGPKSSWVGYGEREAGARLVTILG